VALAWVRLGATPGAEGLVLTGRTQAARLRASRMEDPSRAEFKQNLECKLRIAILIA